MAVGFYGGGGRPRDRRAARKLEDSKRPGTALALRATAQGVRSAVVAAVESLVVWRRKFEPTLDCASCLARVDGAGLSAIAQSAAWGGAAQFGLDQGAKLLGRRVPASATRRCLLWACPSPCATPSSSRRGN